MIIKGSIEFNIFSARDVYVHSVKHQGSMKNVKVSHTHAYSFVSLYHQQCTELQIKRDKRDNLGMIFHITPLKRML